MGDFGPDRRMSSFQIVDRDCGSSFISTSGDVHGSLIGFTARDDDDDTWWSQFFAKGVTKTDDKIGVF